MAKATAEESLMIGDNLEADVMGALNFGMEAICFNYHKEILAADIIGVDHLLELKKYI
jgi:putative hydrolase of the HAD superfamily